MEDANLSRLGGDAIENRSRAVGRSVVDDDHFVVGVSLPQDGGERGLDAGRLVSGGDDDGDARPGVGLQAVAQVPELAPSKDQVQEKQHCDDARSRGDKHHHSRSWNHPP